MSSVIRGSDYLKDAVVVATGGKARHFTLTQLVGVEDEVQVEDEAAAQRAQLETAKHQAERIVAEAEERVAEANAQAAAIREAARAEGYEDGLQQGLQEAEAQSLDYVRQIAQLAENAAVERDTMIRSAQEELSALAIAIAVRVIHREVSTDPSVVLSMVEAALERMPSENQVRILVNPEDLDLVTSQWSKLGSSVPLGCEAEILGDERVDRGGCMIESRGGMVDSRVETQVARIIESFEAER